MAALYWEYWGTPKRCTDLPQNINVINHFHSEPTSGDKSLDGKISFRVPSGQTLASVATDIQTCRGRGQKVVLTVGGAGARFGFGNRAASQTFLNEFHTIYQSLGGVDGIDLNNYEQMTDMTTLETVWVCQQLKARYPNFIVSSPPAATNYLNQAALDGAHLKALHDGGALDFVTPQFYDGPGLDVQSHIITMLNQYIGYGIPQSKMGIGFGIKNAANYWTASEAAAAYTAAKSTFPALRGAFNFSAQGDPSDTYSKTVVPVIMA